MTFLLDTNIWLERLLDQEKAAEVDQLLREVPSNKLAISDFSLHSIGVILWHLNRRDVFSIFVRDLFSESSISLLSLSGIDHLEMAEVQSKHRLDFDDCYQYTICKKFELGLVTFDQDFNKTDLAVFSPLAAIKKINN
ncbi:MAG: PIN domain-containing protein [Cyclobacteriaceae bacterium]|jgi:predicted nucleic acid-binding protein